MNNKIVWFGILSGIAAWIIAKRAGRAPEAAELAHRLEEAWADHHTVA